jgi:RNA polymerase sigma-70 factor, ECF subfamily
VKVTAEQAKPMALKKYAHAWEPFEALVRAHQDRLYGVAYRLAGNRDDAEDLLQQSLIEAYTAFDRFTLGSRFDRWVMRIMHHAFLDTLRRRSRCAVESLDTPRETTEGKLQMHDVVDPRGGPETELMRKTLSEPLQRALDALPAISRSVVVLADMEGLSYEEIAQVLCCPLGTVRSRLHRAREFLRHALAADAVALAGEAPRLRRRGRFLGWGAPSEAPSAEQTLTVASSTAAKPPDRTPAAARRHPLR